MTNEQKLALMKNRLNILESKPQSLKSGGVTRSLRREIRNLESKIMM